MKEAREHKKCEICGKDFIPRDKRQKTCGSEECKYALRRRSQRMYEQMHPKRNRDRYRKIKGEPRKKHVDNIIGEGYAERQIANSLRLAGRINTEL